MPSVWPESHNVALSVVVTVVIVVAAASAAIVVVPVRVVLAQGMSGPEHPVTAVLAPELVAGLIVLVPRMRMHKHPVALAAGARSDFSLVLIQSGAGRENAVQPTIATILLSIICQSCHVILISALVHGAWC